MTKLKVGDVVIFFNSPHEPVKRGQIIGFPTEDECDVYCRDETAVYRVKTEKCKKIS